MKVLHLGKRKHIAAQSSEQTVTWSWTDSVLRYEDKTTVTINCTYWFTCTLTKSELEQSALRKRSQSDKCFVHFSISTWLPFFMYINSLHHCFSIIFLYFLCRYTFKCRNTMFFTWTMSQISLFDYWPRNCPQT